MTRHALVLMILAAALAGPPECALGAAAGGGAPERSAIGRLIGGQDALLAADPGGNAVLSIHADRMLVPASTLKILTALVARHYLGEGFRFKTEIYLDSQENLKIKGFGDPLLISEVIRDISRNISERVSAVNDVLVDGSYFEKVTIPGVSDTLNPYDAPCGALSVNFNTVNFRRSGNRYVSAEAQTPIIPFILDRIRQSGLKAERIVLSAENDEATLYAGHLFRHFLVDAGVRCTGGVAPGVVHPGQDRLVYRHISTFSLDEVIARLLMYSNNFMANQLLITAGIAAYGPPGTLDKGVAAATAYVRDTLKRNDIRIAEGSGISRRNRLTAACMMKILEAFAPHHELMRQEAGVYYKTGSLSGVRTRAGYVRGVDGGLSPFVLLMNTPGKHPDAVMPKLARLLRIR